MARLRGYRLARFQAELRRLDYAGAVLFDPVNLRYATGSRNMAVWILHNPARYGFVPAEGKAVIFDFHGCGHLSDGIETIGEARPARSWFFFPAGNRMQERAELWAEEIAQLVRERCGANRRIAVDRLDPPGLRALEKRGIEVFDAQEPCELARAIKSPDEIACMVQAIAVCEAGIAAMREALKPGITENALWALLHEVNIRLDGEWIETRLLSSGPRTNPWFQECGDRVIRAGELVAFDTDLIGPFGYCADISRTFFCGPGRASERQRRHYALAVEQIEHNMALIRPGLGFREMSEIAWKIPDAYVANRYSSLVHGVGLCDEWPKVVHREDVARSAYDGEFQENMTVCVESYIGEQGGPDGVKLEQQVVVTATGCELLSSFPFDEDLYG
ncbi:MAG: aminopeptidase P family protein [Proteobacteria bacterium]|nr:aminopeptidase P family protein [Pseudomonadota bacterium]